MQHWLLELYPAQQLIEIMNFSPFARSPRTRAVAHAPEPKFGEESVIMRCSKPRFFRHANAAALVTAGAIAGAMLVCAMLHRPVPRRACTVELSDWPMRTHEHQRQVTSQGGQDGVLEHIFSNIGEGGRFYVEFGFDSDGWAGGIGGPNTQQLNVRGWRGLLLDGGHENPAINLHKEFITPENIASLFSKYAVPPSVDYVSIDLDSSDVWVMHALLQNGTWRPRVISTEYNCNYPLQSTLTNAPWARWEKDERGIGDKMMGGSLGAFLAVASEHNYVLVDVVHCLDAFWVRRDELRGAMAPPPTAFQSETRATIHLPVFNRTRIEAGDLVDFASWRATGDMKAAGRVARHLVDAMAIKL